MTCNRLSLKYIQLPEEYNSEDNRKAILTVMSWRETQILKMGGTLLANSLQSTINALGNLDVKGISDIEVKPNYNIDNDSILTKRIHAKQLYSKPNCFCCGVELLWDSTSIQDNSGKMYNNVNENILNPTIWFSVCKKCNTKLQMPYTKLDFLDELKLELQDRGYDYETRS